VSFAENLKQITDNLEGALGVALVGMDGIVVEEYKLDNLLDLPTMAAEFSGVLRQIEEVSENLRIGPSQELSVQGDKALIIIKIINVNYFLLLVIQSEANFGKGRYLLKREMVRMEKEL